ncbi:uncharacterized protein JCM15063_003315 [Sporobolomyces koalae]|uniref:uncharacterized protein n=1 Tax=Sporobolomyces koalae TaxID=500713 RepID=UPI00317462FF
MGLSKKDARTREQKKKEEMGIKVDTTKGGVVKKAPKTQIQCTVCKSMLTESMPIILRDHGKSTEESIPLVIRGFLVTDPYYLVTSAAKHSKLKTPAECFPGATIAA